MASHDDKSVGGESTIGHVARARPLDQLCWRILEVAAATTILLCLAPILLLTAVAIKLDSDGPVFIRETRLDSRNRAIEAFKFRLVTADAGSDGSNRRLTVGLILSGTGIDELPQLVNVVRGEISLIEALKTLL
jgi:lipopolysaccharide/colanic/teichoic acid biosynthesis glycosyltransferase